MHYEPDQEQSRDERDLLAGLDQHESFNKKPERFFGIRPSSVPYIDYILSDGRILEFLTNTGANKNYIKEVVV